MCCNFVALPGAYISNAVKYSDPKQGDTVGDCYLIAAISSIAWVNPANIPAKASPFTYTFWDWSNPQNRVQKNIPAFNNTAFANPIGARSVEAGEIWPAMYEKAYAIFRNLAQEQGCADATHRDITKFTSYNPITTLAEISGLPPVANQCAAGTADTIFNAISGICNNKKTKYPAAAITIAGPGNGLLPRHCYSVLGVQAPYIIMRNPNLVKPGGAGIFNGLWTPVSGQDFNGGAPVAPRLPVTYDLSTMPGVFGLDKAAFKANFESYGWVNL